MFALSREEFEGDDAGLGNGDKLDTAGGYGLPGRPVPSVLLRFNGKMLELLGHECLKRPAVQARYGNVAA
jgi:hypothetical protein